MSEPVVVLGASGNVGTSLTRQLGEQGVAVRAVFAPDSGSPNFADGVEPFPGDFADTGLLERAMAGAGAVFMLTPPSPSQPVWHRTIVDAALASGVRRIVKLSAFDSGPDSPLQMGRWHDDGEVAVKTSGLEYVILRPQYFMQMETAGLRAAISTGVIRGASAGSLRMGFVHVDDIAAVAAVALTSRDHAGRMLVPTGPSAPSYDELAGMLADTIGSPVRYEQRSEEELRASAPFNAWPEWHVEDYLAIHGSAASDLVTTDVLDVTGRPPRTLRSFVEDVVAQG